MTKGIHLPRRLQGAPLYLLLLCGLVFLLLSINGLFEFRRTKEGLYRILEGQGLAYIDSQEKEIRAALTQLSALEGDRQAINPPLRSPYGDLLSLDSAIAEHLMDVALTLDRQEKEGRLSPEQASALMKAEKLSRIEFRGASGRLILAQGEDRPSLNGSTVRALIQGSRPVMLDDFLGGVVLRPHYTLGMKRRYGQGFLLLSLEGAQMQSLRLHWLLEGSRGEQDLGSSLRYLVFQGEDLILLTAEERLRSDEAQADAFLAEAKRGKLPRSRIFKTPWGEEVYEVVKPLSVGPPEPTLLRVGLSLESTGAILSRLRASILLQLFLSMTLALVATLLIFWMQNRYLFRVREMEQKVQMSERLSSLGELAASLAHEIRNPLNAISMGIQRMRRESAGSLSAQEARDLLDLISAEIRRLDSLVERFLGLARPERAVRGEGDLGQIILELFQLFSDEAREKGIELSSSISSDLPSIPMDAERIKQAFLNLIKNAMEAMERASLPPHGQKGSLRVEAHPLGRQYIQVTFSDSGCGIPASEQHRVFDPYYTTKPQGVGLGLSLAYQIIKVHGGQIQIESEEGKGTKVAVTLPRGRLT